MTISASTVSISHFITEYADRATSSFVEALYDYERSNSLLFGDEDEGPKLGGWRLPQDLERQKLRQLQEAVNA